MIIDEYEFKKFPKRTIGKRVKEQEILFRKRNGRWPTAVYLGRAEVAMVAQDKKFSSHEFVQYNEETGKFETKALSIEQWEAEIRQGREYGIKHCKVYLVDTDSHFNVC